MASFRPGFLLLVVAVILSTGLQSIALAGEVGFQYALQELMDMQDVECEAGDHPADFSRYLATFEAASKLAEKPVKLGTVIIRFGPTKSREAAECKDSNEH